TPQSPQLCSKLGSASGLQRTATHSAASFLRCRISYSCRYSATTPPAPTAGIVVWSCNTVTAFRFSDAECFQCLPPSVLMSSPVGPTATHTGPYATSTPERNPSGP